MRSGNNRMVFIFVLLLFFFFAGCFHNEPYGNCTSKRKTDIGIVNIVVSERYDGGDGFFTLRKRFFFIILFRPVPPAADGKSRTG